MQPNTTRQMTNSCACYDKKNVLTASESWFHIANHLRQVNDTAIFDTKNIEMDDVIANVKLTRP